MTTNIQYNPIFRATRAAWCELTTPDARRWYGQQLQTATALANRGLSFVRRWLYASRGQSTIVELSQEDSTEREPAQVSAPTETTALEQSGVTATRAAIEANPTPTEALSEQAIDVADVQAPAADLAHEPESLDLATIEPGASLDYELLDDSQERPTGTNGDEPLSEVETPFSDDLESGPPYLPEEDDSFLNPEEDASDSLLEDDLEPVASVLPADLNERIQAYLQPRGSSVESNGCTPHFLPTPTINYSSTGAEFGE